jgi:hypothetical protein
MGHWSFAESSIDPFFCFSNKLLFRSLFRIARWTL